MKNIKWYVLSALFMAGGAFAQGGAMGAGMGPGAGAAGENFEENKKFMLSQMDEKIQTLQKTKACIEAVSAQDPQRGESMKKCHLEMKEARKEMRMDRMEHKMERLEKRKAMIEKRKEEMEQKK